MKRFLEMIDHALFPYRCACCGRVIDRPDAVCSACGKQLKRIEGTTCPLCGREEQNCRCKGKGCHYESLAAPFLYQGVIRQGIGRLKFHAQVRAAGFFGAEMEKTVRERFCGVTFDLVTCVPMTLKKKKQRGFNQSELLARVLAERLEVPYCAKALMKQYETKEQHTLNAVQRRANVLGIYQAQGDLVEDKRILLVDDVSTTGATFDECAKVCLFAGSNEVYCVAAALSVMADKGSSSRS